jgi:hypothetical protein
MTLKRAVNKALGDLTGLTLTRARQHAETVPVEGNGFVPSAPAPVEQVRPPADPALDRLVRRPVFLLSTVRSGSTLLRSLLNTHSRIHAPHELHVRRLTVGYSTKLSMKAMAELGLNQADLEHLLWDRVLHRELTRSGKDLIVEKTPQNVFAHVRVAACWPDAQYIFLLRHPVSIAQSWQEAHPKTLTFEESVVATAKYMAALERAREDLTGLTVRYEELTSDPATTTRRICEFLAVPWEEGMLAYDSTGFRKGLGDWRSKIRSGTVQPSRALPEPADVPEALRGICRAWGYLPPQ